MVNSEFRTAACVVLFLISELYDMQLSPTHVVDTLGSLVLAMDLSELAALWRIWCVGDDLRLFFRVQQTLLIAILQFMCSSFLAISPLKQWFFNWYSIYWFVMVVHHK
jgi:hypothetical protein